MSMKVMVFDVEHGACAFVKTPTDHAILIDCDADGWHDHDQRHG